MKKKKSIALILSLSLILTGFNYKDENKYYGIRANENYVVSVLGDSIVYGYELPNQDYSFVSLLGEYAGVKINNYGICATTIAINQKQSMVTRYDCIADDTNLIIVFGGSNDFYFATPLGTPDSSDLTTFYGSLNVMIQGMKERYPYSGILLLTPIRRGDECYSNALGLYLENYVEAIKIAGSINGVEVYDLHSVEKLDFLTTYLNDGLHPNEIGHQILARYLYEHIFYNNIA